MDRWLLSRLDATVEAVNDAWAAYDATAGVRALDGVRGGRRLQVVRAAYRSRFWAADSVADPAAVATLHEALRHGEPPARARRAVRQRLAAPRTGGNLGASRPVSGDARRRRDPALEAAMDAVRRLASLAPARAGAEASRCGSRSAAMQVAVPAAVRGTAFDELLELLRREVNVQGDRRGELRRRAGPAAGEAQLPIAGQALRQADAGDRRGGCRASRPSSCAAWRQGTPATHRRERRAGPFLPEDVVVEREVASDWLVASDGPLRRRARPAARPTSSGAREPRARS